jgi:RNA polymerase sigma-70 factor (ECF subfamily)|tara:strand:+ start:4293 stop:4859 length:567 start_codon:yes stop_codon:yes gene_type:complete
MRTQDGRSDKELVEACNVGDANEAAAAFDILYHRHKDYVIRVASRFVRDSDAALDVLQESFIYLLRRFPPSGQGITLSAQLTTLLYPVAKNLAISHLRKSSRFDDAEGTDPDALPGPTVEFADDAIWKELGILSNDHREIVLLRYVDDMSLQDIAAALNIPLGTVKSRLHLALKHLRNSPYVKEKFAP